MKDLDFDEIDRAVNSVSTNKSTSDDVTETPVKSADSLAPEPTRPPQALAGRRSSGHFMDVVHPSSDMRRTPLKMPERTPIQKPVATDTGAPMAPVTAAPSPESDNVPLKPTSPDNNWPDPIEYNESKTNQTDSVDNTKANPNQNEDADIDRISEDITKELGGKIDETLETPFISGTKVEKRPLGAFSTDKSPQDVEQAAQNESTDTISTEEVTEQPAADTSLPDELQDDLLKIESNGDLGNAPTEPVNPVEASKDTSTDVNAAATTTSEVPVAKPQPAVATSITQQYKEQPSTGDQNNGAIYDTDAYHKALVRPVNKKSGWMWVLWIVVLLAVGVGVGVVVYDYVLPLL